MQRHVRIVRSLLCQVQNRVQTRIDTNTNSRALNRTRIHKITRHRLRLQARYSDRIYRLHHIIAIQQRGPLVIRGRGDINGPLRRQGAPLDQRTRLTQTPLRGRLLRLTTPPSIRTSITVARLPIRRRLRVREIYILHQLPDVRPLSVRDRRHFSHKNHFIMIVILRARPSIDRKRVLSQNN